MWVLLGTAAAIGFSSGGPCYYERITGLEDPFRPLMAYLNEVAQQFPFIGIDEQEAVWRMYQAGRRHIIAGISAMPSLHVATAVLGAILGWKTNRWLGIALTMFAVITQVGSVHFGWHYAVDGYLAAAAIGPIWLFSGWITRRINTNALNKVSLRGVPACGRQEMTKRSRTLTGQIATLPLLTLMTMLKEMSIILELINRLKYTRYKASRL